jgi:hypothetical protein
MVTIEYGDGKSFTLSRENANCFGVFKECLADLDVNDLTIPADIECKDETLRNIVRLLDANFEAYRKLPKQQLFDVIKLSNYLNCEKVLVGAACHTLHLMNYMDVKEMRKFFDVGQ